MTSPFPPNPPQITTVEHEELLRRYTELMTPLPLHLRGDNPLPPPCRLQQATRATSYLDLDWFHLSKGIEEWDKARLGLARALWAADTAYGKADEELGQAIRNETSMPEVVMPGLMAEDSGAPALAEPPIGPDPFPDEYKTVIEVAQELEMLGDQGQGLQQLAAHCQANADALLDASRYFEPLREWTGE